MRLAWLLVVALLAGCVDGSEPGDAPDRAPDPRLAAALEDHPTFCDSEEECDFWDEQYHEFVVYDLDTTVIDVVIVPPAGGTAQLAASRQAVQAWSDGIEALAAPWLQEGFTMNIYAVGIDVPTLQSVEDPEIVVMSSSAVGLAGIGLEPKQLACSVIGEEVVTMLDGHEHDGNQIFAADCTGTGFTCFALNVGDIDTIALHDLIAHEVGHCLGAGHVGDALDFSARYAPVEDIMSYQSDPEHVHCVSNMNVRNLEGVYAHLLDRPQEEWLPAGSFMSFPILDYMQVECENPTA